MSEKKLSEELRHCLEDDVCGDCNYHEPEIKFVCRGLLQKAYETVKRHEEIYEIMRPLAERLNEFTTLEEQGRLWKLPCKVGDIVWDIDFGRPCSYEVTGFSFGSLNDDDWEEEKILDQVIIYYTNSSGSITGTFAVSEIGKTVFFTRPEADRALAEMEGKK